MKSGKALFGRFERVHLVGIGGVGMQGLARLLRDMGCRVSGSDHAPSRDLEQLRREGIEAWCGHRATQVEGAELVIYSAAVPADNEERVAAGTLGIPAAARAEVLGELTRAHWTIGVAGSHGKTTTAALLAAVLKSAGWAPSVLVGARMEGRVLAEWGRGAPWVVEADEFERGFLHLHPRAALVTSIDREHLDCYGDLNEVREAFCRYLARLPFYGHAVLAGDDPGVRGILPQVQCEYFTYGRDAGNDFCAARVEVLAQGTRRFDLVFRRRRLGRIELRLRGAHNMHNAVGAAAMAHSLGVEFAPIAAGLQVFAGVERRFEVRAEIEGVLVVDDYAHHPAEVAATLHTARESGRRVVAVFQPHLYSRTRALGAEFARALQAADRVLLAAVYGAREEPQPGVDSGLIARAMREEGYGEVEYIPAVELLCERLLALCRPGDVVVIMGAGDIDQVAARLVEALAGRERKAEN